MVNTATFRIRWSLFIAVFLGMLIGGELLCLTEVFAAVKIEYGSVNIYTAPDEYSTVVAESRRGEEFWLLGEAEGWCRIKMFSPGERFIPLHAVSKIPDPPLRKIPGPVEERQDLYAKLMRADEKARVEADMIYVPGTDENKELYWILEDRYKLKVFRYSHLQPLMYDKLISEQHSEKVEKDS